MDRAQFFPVNPIGCQVASKKVKGSFLEAMVQDEIITWLVTEYFLLFDVKNA